MAVSHMVAQGCHNQLSRCCPTDHKFRDAVGDDGCSLCTELKLLELLREELTRKTSELRVKINLTHSTINRQLPPEILATIFEAYVYDASQEDFFYEEEDSPSASFPKYGNPLRLGAVCRTWRDIAWSAPRIWASMTIVVDYTRPKMQMQLVEDWLGRSGKLPLSIRLVDKMQRNDDIALIRPLISAINRYSTRWCNLHLHLPSCIFPYFRGEVPLLSYLKVDGKHHFRNDDSMDGSSHDVLQFGETPSLRYISTRRISLVNFSVGWDRVTHFAGENVSVVECLEVVRRAPLLEHCIFQSTSGITSTFPIPSSPIISPRLRTFSVTFPNQNGQALMQGVTSPSLESLSVVGPPSGCLLSFFTRSRCPLQRLTLTFFGDQAKCLISLLRSQPSLTALSLGWSPLPDLLLAELAEAYNSTGPKSTFLPHLDTLEFKGMTVDFAWEQFAAIFPPMGEAAVRPWRSVKMTVVRDMGRAGRPGLPYIPEAVIPRLRQAIAAGVEIELNVTASFDASDMKDWLAMSEEHHAVLRERVLDVEVL